MKLLNSKAGVTILEGIIALGLLAVVMAGAFGVLLSASRKSSQPDMREEMILAVEKVKDRLQVYINTANDTTAQGELPADLASGLCTGKKDIEENSLDDTNPLGTGSHNIQCMLPIICDKDSDQSEFFYKVSGESVTLNLADKHTEGTNDEEGKICENCETVTAPTTSNLKIKFTIKCNGYEL